MSRVVAKWNDNGSGQRGDLKAVIKAILLDPELVRGQTVLRVFDASRNSTVSVTTRGTEFTRLREPVVRIASLIRAMRPSSNWAGGYMMLNNSIFEVTEQGPYKSPSVFNFYLPDYQAPDLVGYTPSRRLPYNEVFHPEFQILDSRTMIATFKLAEGVLSIADDILRNDGLPAQWQPWALPDFVQPGPRNSNGER